MEIIRKTASLTQKNAPGEHPANLPAAVLATFGPGLMDARACRGWLLRRLHPAGPACPACGFPPSSPAQRAAFWDGRRLECTACGRFYTSSSGTILESAKLAPAQVVLLALAIALDLPTPTSAALAGVSPGTVRAWSGRLQEAPAA